MSLDSIVNSGNLSKRRSLFSVYQGEGKSHHIDHEIWVCRECMLSHSMASHIVYISGLKPDFAPQELLYSLDFGVNTEEIIRHVEAHGNGTVFLVFADDSSADRCIQRYHGKLLLDSNIQVSRPTPTLLEQLRKMNPGIIKNKLQLQIQKNEPADDATAVSAVFKAIFHLSGSQRELLRKVLEPQSTATPPDPWYG